VSRVVRDGVGRKGGERGAVGEDQGAAVKKGWQRKHIGDLCEVIAGQSPEGKFYNTDGKGMPFYQGKKGFGEKFVEDPTTWTTQTTKVAREGDILMSVRAPVGPVNFATEEICIGRGLAAIRTKAELNRDFLFYQLLHLQPEIAGKEGAVFASINKSEIEALPVAFAPLPEQQRIVGILDEAFEGIATAKANAEKNLQNARALFESHLQSVFTQRGAGWVEKRLVEACVLQRGFDLPTRSRTSGDFPLVSSSGIIDNHNEGPVKGPGVATGRSGSIGNVFYIEEDYWPLNTVLYVKEFYDNNPKFIYRLLSHFDFKRFATGAGVPTLNRNFVHDKPVVIPESNKTQQEIAEQLDALEEETKRLESLYQRKLDALEALKKSLLHRAFSGEL